MVCAYLGTIKGEKLNEPESDPSPICKKNSPNPARMDSTCRVPMDILIGKDDDEYEKEREKKAYKYFRLRVQGSLLLLYVSGALKKNIIQLI